MDTVAEGVVAISDFINAVTGGHVFLSPEVVSVLVAIGGLSSIGLAVGRLKKVFAAEVSTGFLGQLGSSAAIVTGAVLVAQVFFVFTR